MISKELIAASTEPLILAILAEGENYGYALIQRVRAISKDQIQWSEGMLYPVLHRMESSGLIESEWKEGDSGKKRKYYSIKQPGRKVLHESRKQWLAVNQTLNDLWQTIPSPI